MAANIRDLFQLLESELPKDGLVGEEFDIAAVIGPYYSYDDIEFDDFVSAGQLDLELRREFARLAAIAPTARIG